MNAKSIICILIGIALLNIVTAAGEGGVNVEPNVDETIFTEITHTETTTDLEDWEITLTLSDDAINNNTTFELTTQICNNDGVCFPPTIANVTTGDGKIFTSSVTTMEDHSYVNWRVKATYADDNNTTEMFPNKGFFKTWSDCWYNDGEWGGDNCPSEKSSDNESFLPTLGILATTSAVMFAAFIRFE